MEKIAVITEKNFEYAYDGCSIEFIPSGSAVNVNDWAKYDAAFLVAPYSEKDVILWTGHPHLRAVNGVAALTEELHSLFSNVECEKKLLIAYPNLAELEKYHPFHSEIEQVYLQSNKGSHRIRKRVSNGAAAYSETLKIRISGSSCFEYEKHITAEEYNSLLDLADKGRHPIRKKRYCFLFDGQYFELDIYDFWRDKAVIELELRDENQKWKLPPELQLIKDVTDDVRYKNNYLAGIANYEDY